MLEPVAQGDARLRAGLVMAGASIARHQLGLCLAMEVERVLCLARSLTPEVLALQHAAEAAGLRFAMVTGIHQLAANITANDDLLIMADGLLADAEAARDLLAPRHCVAVQPADVGIASGYERLDFVHAFAGVVRMPGRLVAKLGELPADCDAVSSLTRIALQNGIARQEISAALRDGGGWSLIRDEVSAHDAESRWVERLAGATSGVPPSEALLTIVLRRYGPALINARNGTVFTAAIGICLLALGLFGAWFGHLAPALGMLLAGWMALRLDCGVRELSARIFVRNPVPLARAGFVDGVLDVALIIVLTWSASEALPMWDRAFVPLVLVAALHLPVGRHCPLWRRLIGDRLLLLAFLIVAVGVGMLHLAVMTVGLALLVAAVWNRAIREIG